MPFAGKRMAQEIISLQNNMREGRPCSKYTVHIYEIIAMKPPCISIYTN
jgi:hypothetical protein